MPIGEVLKSNVAEVLEALCNVPASASGRGKRKMVDMFMDLPDRESWPEYYEARTCLHRLYNERKITFTYLGHPRTSLHKWCEGKTREERLQECARRALGLKTRLSERVVLQRRGQSNNKGREGLASEK